MLSYKKKIVIGITAPLSVILLEGQLKYFSDAGYEVFLMAPKEDVVSKFCFKENATHLPVDIIREVSILKDIKALIQVIRHLKIIKPDIVNAGTPKMGLLGMIGSYIVGVRKRIYTCRGIRYEHEVGIKRKVLFIMEKLTARLAHHVVCISPSVKEMGIIDNIFNENKAIVLGKGSSNGIDLHKFNKNIIDKQAKSKLAKLLGVENKFVFGFVGRIIDRKGIQELFKAFVEIHKKHENIHLVVVGKANFEQISNKTLFDSMSKYPGISLTGYQDDIPLYMSLFDVFVLPSWWEGFGNSLIQAAAMELPVISTRVTGCVDAVSDGFNGILVKSKSVVELKAAMELLMSDSKERNRLGNNGIVWVKNFDSEKIWQELQLLYDNF